MSLTRKQDKLATPEEHKIVSLIPLQPTGVKNGSDKQKTYYHATTHGFFDKVVVTNRCRFRS